MSDRWTNRLSEYLDGELSPGERRDIEAHLRECAECTHVLEDLRGVLTRARALGDRPPARELWPGIAERLDAAGAQGNMVVDLTSRRSRPGVKRLVFSVPQLIAASIVLMLLSGGTAWILSGGGANVPDSPAAAMDVGSRSLVAGQPPGLPATVRYGDSEFDAAVAELERIIDEQRDELDPETVRIIEQNLRIIDRAIAQAQRALAQDPMSIYLNEHLTATMRQKLEFLRRAAQMTGAVS